MRFQGNIPRLLTWLTIVVIIILNGVSCSTTKTEPRVLVFTKTAGYHHESIPAGIEAIKQLGIKHHFAVDTTENAATFHEEILKRYSAIIFLNTTGDVLNQEQQNDFERFIQAGGGYLGLHAAADTEYDWPWYGKLVGAYFLSHPQNPNVQRGVFRIVEKNNMATDSLPNPWERKDEFYSFKQISPDIKVLIKIDEKTYNGGKNGDDHPMSWYHHYDGGRAFYTSMGHTNETFSDPFFLKHLWGGIHYAMGGDSPDNLNYKQVHTRRVPEENRFTEVILDEKLEEPVELAVLPGNRVLFIERRGNVKIYDPVEKKTKVIATIPVSRKYAFKDNAAGEAEDGLLGLAIDPNFKKNNWVYLYYSPAGDDPKNTLTRYELKGDELVESSKKIILDVVVQRQQCCHTGGSIAFDAQGNLYLSTGDNTSPRATRYAPLDNRPGRSPWDSQKGSANTNDLRGKVIRIHPEDDGTYTIPEGNLFPKGTPKTRPEIYIMGARNPYRISIDKKTGFLYWGDVGPDGGQDSVNRGPRGYDEVNQARKAGFFGWPYFVGDNQAYYERDFVTGKAGSMFDAAKPLNNSPNNTGLVELPPAQKAFIWYPYDVSPEFPLVGKGGRTSMAGPVFYSADFKNAKRAFPDYYDGKLFIYEWMRGWIMTVSMDKEGNYVSMERFMPSTKFSSPIDMEFAPDGDLYLLQYGNGWFTQNDDARLVRIEYNGQNRKPKIQMAADKTKGAVPMDVKFSSAGTKDFDHDEIKYEWKIVSNEGATIKTFAEPNPSFTFDKPGIYKASLLATDSKGEQSTREIEIQAGNEPSVVTIDIIGNQTFYFPNFSFGYDVKVNDKEDGSSENGGISPDQISVRIDHLKEGFDKIEIAQGHVSADEISQFATGKKIMEQSDCKACHMIDKKSVGPMYMEVAKKYKDDPKATDYLANKIINGGSGVWGDAAMAAHPQLPLADVKEIVKYVLSLGSVGEIKSFPPKGNYTTVIPNGESDKGALILRASYSDKSVNGVPSITSEKTVVLKSSNVAANLADATEGVRRVKITEPPVEMMVGSGNNSYLKFNQVDLSGIDQVVFTVMAQEPRSAGGLVEVHIDSLAGNIIGKSNAIVPAKANVKGQVTFPTPQMAKAKLTPTNGKHDIYFVYRNEKLPEGKSLFLLLNIQYLANAKQIVKR